MSVVLQKEGEEDEKVSIFSGVVNLLQRVCITLLQ